VTDAYTDKRRFMFKQCASNAEVLPYGEGYVARANYALARIHASKAEGRKSAECKRIADAARHKLSSQTDENSQGYDLEAPGALIPWMLW
jgi:uncharacterized protein YegP (UPF0339 family)